MPPDALLVRVWLQYPAMPDQPSRAFTTLVRSRDGAPDPVEDAIGEAKRRAGIVRGYQGPCVVRVRVLGVALGSFAQEDDAPPSLHERPVHRTRFDRYS